MRRDRLSLLVWLWLAPVLGAATVPGRYIVELNAEPVARHVARVGGRLGMRSASAATYRTQVRQEQTRLRQNIQQANGTVLDTVSTVANAMFVKTDAAGAAQMAALPGVKRVLPERTFHMVLDRAVMIHKVADAWNRVGIDSAGAGVKIGIIDSGIDVSHPGFQDDSLPAPDGFPLADNYPLRRGRTASDLAFTNNKVIVARSYVYLLGYDADYSAQDHVGHGTALGMVAAGVRNAGPLAVIEGMAPKAYLGSYKVFGTPGYNDGTTDSAILKALDDAVADGMDIISMSLGSDLAPRLADDLEVQAVENAYKAGVLVVIAAGNSGPDLNTVSSPGTAPSAITVGASTSDRTFAASVEVQGLSSYVAVLGNAPTPAAPVSANLADVAALDGTGEACSSLPAGSLNGRIALILRGSCYFETKLINAQNAGALAAVVYATAASPDPIPMGVGAASLPAAMVANPDGVAIKQALADGNDAVGTVHFDLGPVPVPANRLTDFGGAGPNVDGGIKPDLVAVGANVYTATESYDPNGDMYDPSGYTLVDGTSFSTPMVAGVAALIKSARPGLTPDQYRSLVIDTAGVVEAGADGVAPGVQQTGGGLLDADAAVASTVAAYPASLSLGTGGTDPQLTRTLTLTNLGTNDETLAVQVVPQGDQAAPAVDNGTVQLAPGDSGDVTVTWNGSSLAPGAYQGFITVTGASSGTTLKVPYWYAVTSTEAARVTIFDPLTSGRRGSTQSDGILFRVTDAAGVPMTDVQPEVTVTAGNGHVLQVVSHDTDVPGVFGVDLVLGLTPGDNVFHIQVGSAGTDVDIVGQ